MTWQDWALLIVAAVNTIAVIHWVVTLALALIGGFCVGVGTIGLFFALEEWKEQRKHRRES